MSSEKIYTRYYLSYDSETTIYGVIASDRQTKIFLIYNNSRYFNLLITNKNFSSKFLVEF